MGSICTRSWGICPRRVRVLSGKGHRNKVCEGVPVATSVPSLPSRTAMLAWLEQAEARLHHDAAIYDVRRTQRLLQGEIADDQPANDVRRLMVTGLRTWGATNRVVTEQERHLLINEQIAAALVPLVLVPYAPSGWVSALAAFSSRALAERVLRWRDSLPAPRPDGLSEQQRAAVLGDIDRRDVLEGAEKLTEEWAAIERGEREVAAAFLAGEQVHEARYWTVRQAVVAPQGTVVRQHGPSTATSAIGECDTKPWQPMD